MPTLLDEFAGLLTESEGKIPRQILFPDIPEMINVAIGMRRSGKTTLLLQKARELIAEGLSLQQMLYINFEDDRLLPMDQRELAALLDAFFSLYPENHERITYLFLDEIQNIEGWPLVVRRFYDRKKVRIYLSGSSAKMLSKEISTSLRGRSIATEVWPFNFAEHRVANQSPPIEWPLSQRVYDQLHKEFQEYLVIGGFPAVHGLPEHERRTVLQGYVDAVVFRDIIERYKITNTTLVKYLMKVLISNVASPFSVNKLYRECKSQGHRVGRDTLYLYLDYIEDAFLAFTVPLFTESLRKQQSHPRKIYIVDSGLVCANLMKISSKWGSLFENLIYLELRRSGRKVHYYQTKEGYEIDFVVESGGTLELIQAVWDATDADTLAREKRALKSAEQELGIKGRIIDPKTYLENPELFC